MQTQQSFSSRSSINGVHSTAMSSIRLPKIELPSFDGNYLEWTKFKDLFTSMVHNNTEIGKAQKLHYLKSVIKGDAATILHSIEVTDANYDEAWCLLEERYQKERQIIMSHMK